MSVQKHMEVILHKDIISAIQAGIGLNDDLAEITATSVLKQLQKNWGGREIYIPVADSRDKKTLVKQDFIGTNHAEVCKRYDISLRTLYRYINN